ncbi:unannotated protein [freshwater metagenome]|uniref:Unannotated protein n=1 Tax=freshwater metagenome TaxID=449393 RepID=A0A6J6LS54_9ZZZZ|nr:hypothetical protein [Actinomycetota bacterium]
MANQNWVFPNVIGRDLLGTEFKLPMQFPADVNVAVIAFQQWQQSQVDAWITALAEAGIPESPFNTREMKSCILELPVLSGKFKLVRRFIDGGMAASIKNPFVLSRTITIYGAVGDFQQSLGITSASDVSVRLVTRAGEVIWGTTGAANAVEVGAICDLVAADPRWSSQVVHR